MVDEMSEKKKHRTIEIYKKIFKPILNLLTAVMIMMFAAGLFFLGGFIEREEGKSLMTVDYRLTIMQEQINTGFIETKKQIVQLRNNNFLTESEVMNFLSLTSADLKNWRILELKYYDILGKRFYFENDILEFIKARRVKE